MSELNECVVCGLKTSSSRLKPDGSHRNLSDCVEHQRIEINRLKTEVARLFLRIVKLEEKSK